jgi:pyroglutamyl-peptidase
MPIWGVRQSPSGEIARLWASGELKIDGTETKAVILPQQFGMDAKILWTEIAMFKPHIILMFGATQRNDPVRLERFYINVEHTPMGDNTKIPVKDRRIVQDGPPGYESTLPIHYLIDKLLESGIESKISYHAGTHTCNSLAYSMMHLLKNNQFGHPILAGFVHMAFPNEMGVIEDAMWTTATARMSNSSLSQRIVLARQGRQGQPYAAYLAVGALVNIFQPDLIRLW